MSLDFDSLFEKSAVQQFCFTGVALLFVFATLRDEIGHNLHIKLPARSGPKLVELGAERKVVLVKRTSKVKLCLEKNLSSMYKEEKISISKSK